MSEKWYVDENELYIWVVMANGDRTFREIKNTPGSRRNAHLIAAAPEMLELLKVCRKGIRAIMEDDRFGDYWGLCEAMDRVIALAEGDEK